MEIHGATTPPFIYCNPSIFPAEQTAAAVPSVRVQFLGGDLDVGRTRLFLMSGNQSNGSAPEEFCEAIVVAVVSQGWDSCDCCLPSCLMTCHQFVPFFFIRMMFM